MHALKTPAFLKPASRPSSPTPPTTPSRPDSGAGLDRVPRPLTRLGLSNFKRSSTPISTPLSPLTQATLVQDGSYLEAVGLKLSSACSAALTQPHGPSLTPYELLNGKRPIPVGRGRSLGSLIAGELNACRSNPHLYKALLRLLQRPLSVMLTNLSSQLLPLLSSPAFLMPPAPTIQNPNPNPTQMHGMGLATFAGEILETFDLLGLGLDSDPRGDGLKGVREGLVSLVSRVVNPLMGGLKRELVPLIEALEAPASATPVNGVSLPSASKGGSSNGGKVQGLHPSIIALQASMPVYSQTLARYTTTQTSQASLASLLISLVWRGLVAFAHRPILGLSCGPASSPRSSDVLTAGALPPSPNLANSATVVKRLNSSTTPPTTPPPSRFTLKLPPSRPPSPPFVPTPNAAADARALCDLLYMLPKPIEDTESNQLAREAVQEAMEGFAALCSLLEFLSSHTLKSVVELEELTEDIPVLIALPVLLQAVWGGSNDHMHSPATVLGLSEAEYRETCLAGFGRAEECAHVVVQQLLHVVGTERPDSPVIHWLRARLNASR